MMDYMLGHMEDLAAKAVKVGCVASRFITPAEQQSTAVLFTRRRDVTLSFDGGYEGAERVRAIFLNPDWGSYDRTELFTALKITVPPPTLAYAGVVETLGHRDILGAVMSLGIERDTIGDILESPLSLICLPELSGYITENLTKAGRAGITLTAVDLAELSAKAEKLTVKTDTVTSLRLDAVLCAAFDLSRSKAVELIEAERVSLDHEPCLQPAKELRTGSLLSVRGMGRVKLLEVGGVSRKGRMFVKIGMYGR